MDIKALKQFELLKHLSDEQLILLVSQSKVLKLQPGEPLITAGEQDNNEYFLLVGTLSVSKPDAAPSKTVLTAQTPEALKPISPEQPHKYNVTSHTAAAVLQITQENLKALLNETAFADYQVNQSLRDNQPEDKQLFFDIYADLRNNKLNLPSLPDVAIKVRQLIDRGDKAENIATAVNSDPAIAAKLIKAANSPLFRGTREFETSAQAIVRLGLQTTKQLVTSFTIGNLYKAKDPAIRKRMDELWQHSIEIAAICHVLAKKTGLDPQQGLLAGLLHQIGYVPLIIYSARYPKLVKDPELLNKILDEFGANLGGVILKRWGFNNKLVTVAEKANQWQRRHDGPADYCDLVQVAQQLFNRHNNCAKNTDLEQLPAFEKLTHGELKAEDNLAILEDAQEHIDATRALLQ